MRKDKQIAIDLRRSGKSYQEISEALAVPKSTLSNWFQGAPWSQETRQQLDILNRKQAKERMSLLAQAAKEERTRLYQARRVEARKIYERWKDDRLFVAGLMLYWGEGDRFLNNGAIRVANTDPYMLRVFHAFLRRFLPDIAHKVSAYLILYPDLINQQCLQYWSEHISVALDKFMKTHYIEGRHPHKRLPYGICTIYVSSRQHKEMMDEWLQLVRQDQSFHAGIV